MFWPINSTLASGKSASPTTRPDLTRILHSWVINFLIVYNYQIVSASDNFLNALNQSTTRDNICSLIRALRLVMWPLGRQVRTVSDKTPVSDEHKHRHTKHPAQKIKRFLSSHGWKLRNQKKQAESQNAAGQASHDGMRLTGVELSVVSHPHHAYRHAVTSLSPIYLFFELCGLHAFQYSRQAKLNRYTNSVIIYGIESWSNSSLSIPDLLVACW